MLFAMKDFDILWRFVFEADEQAAAQAAADEVARLLALEGLPPVAAYKEKDWWKTDVVVGAREESLAVRGLRASTGHCWRSG